MCTVTLERRPGARFVVTMNRDERWGRAPERAPVCHPGCDGGPDWLAPADGERGGTWMGVNADGVAACVLNGYAEADLELLGRPGVPSRGGLLTVLLALPAAGLEPWLSRDLDPTPYPSFTLLVVDRERTLELCWRLGDGLVRRERRGAFDMVSSSFWRTDEVLAWRRQRFDEWVAAGAPKRGGVPELNLLEVSGRREWSPFMTRSFSATRSVTQATVGSTAVGLRYWRRDGEEPIDPERPDVVLEAARRPLQRVES